MRIDRFALFLIAFLCLAVAGCDASTEPTDSDDESQIEGFQLNGLWEVPADNGLWYFSIEYPNLRVYELNNDDDCYYDDGVYDMERVSSDRFAVLDVENDEDLILEWVRGPGAPGTGLLTFIDPASGDAGPSIQRSFRSVSELTVCS